MRPADFLLLLILAALWGGSFLFLRIAAPEFGAVPLIGIRVAVAAAVLLPFLVSHPEWRAGIRRHWQPLLVLGAINAAVPFPLFAYASIHVTAGFASILNATAPLFAAIVAAFWLGDRLPRSGVVGLFVGFGGVVVLVDGVPDLNEEVVLAVLAGLAGSLMYGVSASWIKRRLNGVDSWITTIGSYGAAAILLAPLTVLQWPDSVPSLRAWMCVLLLAVACTSIPNLYYFRLLQRVGPARAMAVAFLIPAFGMLWGALVLGERVTPNMVLGCSVILVGTSLVTGLASFWWRSLRDAT